MHSRIHDHLSTPEHLRRSNGQDSGNESTRTEESLGNYSPHRHNKKVPRELVVRSAVCALVSPLSAFHTIRHIRHIWLRPWTVESKSSTLRSNNGTSYLNKRALHSYPLPSELGLRPHTVWLMDELHLQEGFLLSIMPALGLLLKACNTLIVFAGSPITRRYESLRSI
ncbi:hypothetical protein BC629DRAFT_568278 [Irpex lacteus]|nr:hypothetical protein BC629DRAFT_568278 [Irpex lacteus]